MKIVAFFFLLYCFDSFSQVLPTERRVDWSVAGLKDTTTVGFTVLDALAEGLFNDGITPSDYPLGSLMLNHQEPIIIYFPPGDYLFNAAIPMRSNMVIRGAGATATRFIIDHGGTGNGVNIHGFSAASDTTSVIETGIKGQSFLRVSNASLFQPGQWIQLIQEDVDLVTSSWAIKSVGQIMRINSSSQDTLFFDSELRMDYNLSRMPYLKKIVPVTNAGIECVSFERMDNCAPEQASIIHFEYAANCWINGIASNKTTFSHVEASHCSNLSVSHSYFHHAFDYGGGGRAYGVMLHFTTNECLIYGNTFEHLRHSMILQAGANGNVFAYNRSVDPFWSEGLFFPSNSAGDMVLHGNYPFANLFEQNDGQNMVIDNSHGANGPYNTYFRNRGSLFGIFFSDNTSPSQNFIGNEIPNTGTPYSLVNYTILGTDQFVYGNNNKGTIVPSGTSVLTDSSYFLTAQPSNIPTGYFASIGTPNAMNSGSIPATYYHSTGNHFAEACGYTSDLSLSTAALPAILVYPNPVAQGEALHIPGEWEEIQVFDLSGRLVQSNSFTSGGINLTLAPGSYRLSVMNNGGMSEGMLVVE